MAKKKKIPVEKDVCPKCGYDLGLDYGESTIDEELIGYDWVCSNCKATGVEWYRMEFSSHAVMDEQTKKYESFDA